jgi:uncharacterized membrane protein YjjB (DUF3815 family)
MKNEIIQVLSAFIGTFGFSVLFNVRGKRLFFASLGGLIAWLFFVIFKIFIPSEVTIYFIVALIASLYAEIMARLLKTPTTTFIITALIPLIPGSSLYYTMSYAFQSDLEKFMHKGIYTLELASSLALGVIIASAFIKLIFRKNRLSSKS